jgi:hypothetical protein
MGASQAMEKHTTNSMLLYVLLFPPVSEALLPAFPTPHTRRRFHSSDCAFPMQI